MVLIRGTARCGKTTKELVSRLEKQDIAVIAHRDLDELAACSLIDSGVQAVINCEPSTSGRYPNPGPSQLIEAGVSLMEGWEELLEEIEDGEELMIDGDRLYSGGRMLARLEILDKPSIEAKMERARENLEFELDRFVENTLDYARREKDFILGWLDLPRLTAPIRGRPVLVVVRGKNYQEDLAAIATYINEEKPLLVGVDGGGDALRETGFNPDIVVGDMDSVSDATLLSTPELIVHAYPDGRAPGKERLSQLGLQGRIFKAPGTSEDIALLLAYEYGAELIVAVGTHSSMIDFLEKDRPGMGSTFLVRLKVGERLVDAKGVSKLYRSRARACEIRRLVMAALIPVLIVVLISPLLQQYLRLLLIHLRLWFGF